MKQQQQWEHQISIKCRRESLNTLRKFACNVLSEWSITDEQQYLLVLALDEVCANIIIHAHRCNDNDEIGIKIIRETNNVYFEVSDTKPDNFNINLYEAPTTSQIICEKKRSGMGLFLVKQIMDEITIEQSEGLKICRMKKLIST